MQYNADWSKQRSETLESRRVLADWFGQLTAGDSRERPELFLSSARLKSLYVRRCRAVPVRHVGDREQSIGTSSFVFRGGEYAGVCVRLYKRGLQLLYR